MEISELKSAIMADIVSYDTDMLTDMRDAIINIQANKACNAYNEDKEAAEWAAYSEVKAIFALYLSLTIKTHVECRAEIVKTWGQSSYAEKLLSLYEVVDMYNDDYSEIIGTRYELKGCLERYLLELEDLISDFDKDTNYWENVESE